MTFTTKHFHYTSDQDTRQGTRLAYIKILDGDTLLAIVSEPDHLNQLNSVTAALFGGPAPVEEHALSVRCDIRSVENDALTMFLSATFPGRSFTFDAIPNWTWRDNPNGAQEMPWNFPDPVSAVPKT